MADIIRIYDDRFVCYLAADTPAAGIVVFKASECGAMLPSAEAYPRCLLFNSNRPLF